MGDTMEEYGRNDHAAGNDFRNPAQEKGENFWL
jgi:hypothetical protein